MKMYSIEKLHSGLEQELEPLLEAHWREIARHREINRLNPDYEKYYSAQHQDNLRIYTLRDDDGLIGYAVYFLSHNPHYQDSLQAVNDVVFVMTEHRGLASVRLLQYAEQKLQEDGVEIVTMHMKVAHDHPKLFNTLGYDHSENVYEKVLKR